MPPSGDKALRKNVPLGLARATRELAENLLTWRKLRGLTQAQLADRANVSRDTLARLESGGGASLDTLLRVLRGLGLLDTLTEALDPMRSDIGRLRSDEALPKRVRPKNLGGAGPKGPRPQS